MPPIKTPFSIVTDIESMWTSRRLNRLLTVDLIRGNPVLNLSKLFPFEESLQVSHAISGIPQHSNQTTVKFVGNFAGF